MTVIRWFEDEIKNSKWFLPSLWQVFLGFYFIKFFLEPLPFEGMWLSIILLVIYLLAYFWGYYQEEQLRFKAGLVMLACAVIATPYNYGASVFFQFSTFYLANSSKPARALLSITVVIACILFMTYRFQLPITNFLMPALIVSLSLGLFGIFERQKRLNEESLKKSEHEVKRIAAIAERERIARDLHDVLGHTLTVITLKSSLSKQLLANQQYSLAEK